MGIIEKKVWKEIEWIICDNDDDKCWIIYWDIWNITIFQIPELDGQVIIWELWREENFKIFWFLEFKFGWQIFFILFMFEIRNLSSSSLININDWQEFLMSSSSPPSVIFSIKFMSIWLHCVCVCETNIRKNWDSATT